VISILLIIKNGIKKTIMPSLIRLSRLLPEEGLYTPLRSATLLLPFITANQPPQFHLHIPFWLKNFHLISLVAKDSTLEEDILIEMISIIAKERLSPPLI
jgi:hypothetical protein